MLNGSDKLIAFGNLICSSKRLVFGLNQVGALLNKDWGQIGKTTPSQVTGAWSYLSSELRRNMHSDVKP